MEPHSWRPNDPPLSPGSLSTPRSTPAVLNMRETAILPHILLCTKDLSRLQFDWDKLAQRLHMKNPRSAANSWLAVRKKIETISSSASSAESPSPPPRLTQNDQRFLANAVSCTKRALELDYAALASRLGMLNPRSAANAWGGIKKKIEADMASAIDVKARGRSTDQRRKSKRHVATITTVRQPDKVAKHDELRLQSAAATAQPFSFKVVKCKTDLKNSEKQSAGRKCAKGDSDSDDAYDLSSKEALSTRHTHMTALAALDEAEQGRLRVGPEFWDEC